MRLAMLIAAACLGLAASAHADGKDGKTLSVAPIAPLEATGTEAVYEPAALPPGHEPNVYRFGATYAVVSSVSSLACEAACDDDLSCKAWSFVDTYGASPARCELKRGQGRKEENPLATSGIALALKKAALGETPVPAAQPVPEPGQLQGGVTPAPVPSLP
ncbi:conserved domain protein [Hyphomonas neptunium ATCC 15444]|uniref:Conserved domain protein n=2 Tax=Hyphomonas TaxID=85 RepID=Q0C462_HYPNA|nr:MULTISPECIES: PAN domain-containing protein [Hyphomonas]ABI77723.1 conserved domain protein [Hyphomonas neptunium ATCC 15444]KCZ96307.1 hypothetical protein HHI_01470 [Hyphomonas hirschiana VP5]